MPDSRRLQRLRDGPRFEPLTRRCGWIDSHLECRDICLGLSSEVDDSLYLRHLALHLAGQLSQRWQVLAENLDGDTGARAGQHVVDTMRDRLANRHIGAGQKRNLLTQ